eukprot:jgi/Ulvmu1/468/UM001_0476.1
MSESAGGPSVDDALLAATEQEDDALLVATEEEVVLPESTDRPAMRNWKRAAAAVERETGLDVHAHHDFPQHLGGLSRKFVTKIVTVIGEQSYTWEARQHRRNRAQWQEVEEKLELHRFAVFDAGRIRAAMSNPVKRISFWVGPMFFLGAALFVAGAVSQTDPGFWSGEWTPAQKLAFVDIPFFVGAVAFFLGCYASFIEAVNVDVSDAWDDWEASGRKQPPPLVWYAPWPPSLDSPQLGFYGLLIQYLGSIIFLLGCGTEVVNRARPLGHTAVTWLLSFPYLVGGMCFAVGAFLLAAEGSHSWWRGLLPPLRLDEARSVNYWLEFLNWFGSLLFALGGAGGWWLEGLSAEQEIAQTAATWLLGSAVFVVQGMLLYLEMVNPAW